MENEKMLELSDIASQLKMNIADIVLNFKKIGIHVSENPKDKISITQFEILKKDVERIKFIKRIEIKKLWGTHDVEWDLDIKTNILIGENGSGKSSIINLMNAVINEGQSEVEDKSKYSYKFDEIIIFFDNGRILFYKKVANDKTQVNDMLDKVHSTVELSKNVMEDAKKYLKETPLKIFNLEPFNVEFTNVGGGYWATNIPKKDRKNITDLIDILRISTFDDYLKESKLVEFVSRDAYINTELDIELRRISSRFISYQLKLKKVEAERIAQIENQIRELATKDSADFKELENLRSNLKEIEKIKADIHKRKNDFINTVNELFKNRSFPELNKTIGFDKDNDIIFSKEDKSIVRIDQLSSGEKQILLILLTVLLQEDKNGILLMDEPEISLHLKWQIELIDTIQKLNPNLQIIISTHSAGIFKKAKWDEKTIEISRLFKNSKN